MYKIWVYLKKIQNKYLYNRLLVSNDVQIGNDLDIYCSKEYLKCSVFKVDFLQKNFS